MLQFSLVCILVMVVLLSATLCQAATITGLESSYNVDENFDGTIASFTVDPADTEVTFDGNGLTHKEQSDTQGTYDITFTSSPDYEVETQRSFTFTVTVEGGGASATVTVNDVNEAPAITEGPATHSVEETPAEEAEKEDVTEEVDVEIGTYTASDPEDNDITWTIGGEDSSFFSITRKGVLFFTPSSGLDYEKQESYSVTVIASDGTNETPLSVTVIIINVEESGTVTLSPESRLRVGGTVVATLSDPDLSVRGVTWQWKRDGADIPGETSDSYTAAEADEGKSLSVTATYYDGIGENADTAHASVDTVLPENNRPPEIDEGFSDTETHVENHHSNWVRTYTAVDSDGDELTWSLTEGGDDFDIRSERGVVSFKQSPDFEDQSSYSFTVQVSDGEDEDTHTVTVTIVNVDESGTVTLSSDGALRVGGTVTATLSDPDATAENLAEATWQWKRDGTEIEGATSDSYTAGTPDEDQELTVIVTYTDIFGPGKSATESKTVLPVENRPPEITGMPEDFLLHNEHDENDESDESIVDTYTAVDSDGDELTWSLTEGGDDFEIDQETGAVSFKLSPDFETQSSYSFTVQVSDGYEEGEDTHYVTVAIANVDEEGEVILMVSGDTNTLETGQTVTAKLEDPDSDIISNVLWQWSRDGTEIEGATSASYTAAEADEGKSLSVTATYYDGVGDADARDTAKGDVDTFLANRTSMTSTPQPPSTPDAPAKPEDVNGDGVVDAKDIVFVVTNLGEEDEPMADVNGDGVVDLADIGQVALAFDDGAAAPVAHGEALNVVTPERVREWIAQAILSGENQEAILALEQLLSLLTPKQTTLLANYPNPFNPETWIPYQLSVETNVQISIYDINGALIRQLDLGYQQGGYYTDRSRAAYWDGRNEFGERVASGIYFYTLTAPDFSATRKMLIGK